jgi:hypothetical protein
MTICFINSLLLSVFHIAPKMRFSEERFLLTVRSGLLSVGTGLLCDRIVRDDLESGATVTTPPSNDGVM